MATEALADSKIDIITCMHDSWSYLKLCLEQVPELGSGLKVVDLSSWERV